MSGNEPTPMCYEGIADKAVMFTVVLLIAKF